MLAKDPELRDVQSLMTVGSFGQAPAAKRDMPPGFWAVFYGKVNHHMLKATRWDRAADGLAFETCDLHTLQAIINDQPLQVTRLYKDGCELMGTRAARLEISAVGESAYVRLFHQEEGLNEIERVVSAIRNKKRG